MILSRVDLPDSTTDTGSVVPYYDEHIFRDEA